MQKYSDSDVNHYFNLYCALTHFLVECLYDESEWGKEGKKKKKNSRSWQRSMPFDRLQHRLR